MKTEIKVPKAGVDKAKANLKAAFGKYKSIIVEKDDCWTEDLKQTITH